MSLKTYINNEIQAFRKKATGDLNFGIQYGPTNAILGIHDAYPNSEIADPISIDLVKIGITGTYDSSTGLYNYTEIERISLPLGVITYDVTTEQYLVNPSVEIGILMEKCIYFIEFSNGTDTFKTEAFNTNEILNPAGILDLEVSAWVARVIANSGTVSESTSDKVNVLVKAIKSNGLRSRFLRLNLFVGDNLAACLTPIFLNNTESPSVFFGNTYDTNNNFIEGDYSESGVSGGLQGNGATKYLNTGFNAFSETALGLDTGGLLSYCRTETPSDPGTFIGCNDQSLPSSQFRTLYVANFVSTALFFQGSDNHDIADARGIFIGTRFNASDIGLYNNGVLAVAATIINVKKPNYPITVFAQNLEGSINQYTNSLLSCYAINEKIANDTEAATISTLLNNFYTDFSRNEY